MPPDRRLRRSVRPAAHEDDQIAQRVDLDRVTGLDDGGAVELLDDRRPFEAGAGREAVEQAKIRLSSQTETEISIPFLTPDFSFSYKLTREELERLTKDIIERTRAHCLRSLADAKLEVQDLDQVILVGGQTRMPLVRRLVAEWFGCAEFTEERGGLRIGDQYHQRSGPLLNTYAEAHANDLAWKNAIAPINHIPPAAERSVPQFLTRGTRDQLIRDEMVKEFTDALVKAGQRVEYVQVGGAGHAFFDWKPDDRTKATFAQYGVYYAASMKRFFESTLYP